MLNLRETVVKLSLCKKNDQPPPPKKILATPLVSYKLITQSPFKHLSREHGNFYCFPKKKKNIRFKIFIIWHRLGYLKTTHYNNIF